METKYAKPDDPFENELIKFSWRTSSLCGECKECVEVGCVCDGGQDDVVAIRDTKDRARGMLRVSSRTWATFTRNLDALR